MTTRADLYALIDGLPESQLEQARRSLEAISSPFDRALAEAPIDDEPETDAERAAVEEARESLRRGEEGISLDELRRDLGL